jgi:hypothetical protein
MRCLAVATLVSGAAALAGPPASAPAPAPAAPPPKPTAPPGARARIVVEPIPSTRPAIAIVRCETRGLAVGRGGPHVVWHLGSGVHFHGGVAPRDEEAVLVSIPDAPRSGEAAIACDATDDEGATVTAATVLAPITLTRAAVTEPLVRVEGAHFGASRGPDDAIVFVPPRGRTVRADHACPQASWSDTVAVACVPTVLEAGRIYEIRLQAGGRLGRIAGSPSLYTGRALTSGAKPR